MPRWLRSSLVFWVLAVATMGATAARQAPFAWDLPPGFPPPRVPVDNAMSDAKVRLGRYLFYDKRLSGNGTQSCATCHQQARAFTDGRAQAIGSTGEAHPRGSMSLVNVAYSSALTWANPRVSRLEEQARVPMFGAHPLELGLASSGPWLDAIRRDQTYRPLFTEAFGLDSGRVGVDEVSDPRAAPDFSGRWRIDAARGTSAGGGRGGGRGTGGGLGLGPSADELTIRQDAQSLTIDERRGSEMTHVVYGLDGRPLTNTLGAGRSAGAPAVFVSEWKDGRLITTITAPPAPGSDVKTRYQEVRYLDRDGSLVVETTIPGQPNSRLVVYRKS